MLILPTSGRVDRFRGLPDGGGAGADDADVPDGRPAPLVAGVGARGRLSGSIGFQESFRAPRVPFATAAG
jgi:hypothetical protein